MRKFLTIVVIFIFFGILDPIFAGEPALKNVIIISVDTLRADRLGCYGYPRDTSPAIDALAKDSIRFSHCYTLTPLTGPAFSTMLTSLPAYKHGAKRNGLSIYRSIKTLPWYLEKYGYYCGALISNWPLRKKLSDLHRDFDDYKEVFTKKRWLGIMQPEGKAPDVTENAIKWLEQHRGKRFFLWVHYTDPHAPYLFHNRFSTILERIDASFYPPGMHRKKSDQYDTEVAFCDFYIGKLIRKIKELDLYDEALIIFNSDHGESLGEHNYFKHGRKLYNSTLHVPLTVKLPQNRLENRVQPGNVTLMEVAPTIFSVMNLPIPEKMEGISLLPLLSTDEKEKDPGDIFLEAYRGAARLNRSIKYHLKVKPMRYGVVNGSTKFIYSIGSRKCETYDLEKDRFETHNLYYKNRKEYAPLKERLLAHIKEVKKYIEYGRKHLKQKSKLSKEDIEKFKTLGYID